MEIFSEVLDRTNDWLKFAEAKNALLVAASGTTVWAATRVTLGGDLTAASQLYLWGVVVCFSLAGLLGIASFLPVLRFSEILIGRKASESDNLLFFAHLATLRPAKLVEALLEATETPAESKPILLAYAHQIVVNARIALAKFTLFKWGVRLLVLGILTVPLGALALWIFERKLRGNVDG